MLQLGLNQDKLHKVCDCYIDMFSKHAKDIGKTNLEKMTLIPKDNI